MIRWKWQYEILTFDGKVSSRITAEHDDEVIENVRDRFREFLRGCGYGAGELYDHVEDYGEHVFSELLQERIDAALDYIGVMWNHQATDRSAYRADLANLTTILEGNQEAQE